VIKTAFSSLACPAWDLATIVAKAKEYGFDGIELRGLQGELHLPLVPELAGQPEQVRRRLAEHKIELVCLGTSATLDSRDAKKIARQKGVLTEYIELASRVGCPAVRMFVGEVQGRLDNSRAALARMSETIRSLTPLLSRFGVRLLMENGGDFPGSQDLWFLIDSVGHPLVRCCWNQYSARILGERATISVPRLGHKIGLVHLVDAELNAAGVPTDYRVVGRGNAEIARQIELLRGIAYDGFLVFEWPKLWIESLAEPEAVLPAAAKYLREKIQELQPVLSAYKGDKNAAHIVRRTQTGASAG
jgi:sugar phosphate isomerase/epimerase